jgi:hypothetical protein
LAYSACPGVDPGKRKPAELPVRQAAKFEPKVNHRIANTLGLIVAPSVRVRACEAADSSLASRLRLSGWR